MRNGTSTRRGFEKRVGSRNRVPPIDFAEIMVAYRADVECHLRRAVDR